jgi:4'-phosphopantetheinyl transferase
MEQIKINCLNLGFPPKGLGFTIEEQDSILLYAIKLEDFIAHISYLSGLCSPIELARSRRYLSETDNHRFVVTRGLLRMVLAKILQTEPQLIKIGIGENKKPQLKENPLGISFNISHTSEYAMIAVSKTLIGVDVEDALNVIDYPPIMEACFSMNEIIFVRTQADALKAFYTIWTRKESILKLIGKGIDDDMKQIEVLNGMNSIDSIVFLQEDRTYQIATFELPEGKIASLACLATVDLEHVKFVNLNSEIFKVEQNDPINV